MNKSFSIFLFIQRKGYEKRSEGIGQQAEETEGQTSKDKNNKR